MLKKLFEILKKGVLVVGKVVQLVVNTVLLSIVYLVGVGLTSIIAKLVGKHFLEIKKNKSVKSYWKKLDLKKEPKDNYYKQF